MTPIDTINNLFHLNIQLYLPFGYDLLLMSKDSFTKEKNKTQPILIKDEDGSYSLWGYKEEMWQLTKLVNFELPSAWEGKQKVHVFTNTRLFKMLKANHHFVELALIPSVSKPQDVTPITIFHDGYNHFQGLLFPRMTEEKTSSNLSSLNKKVPSIKEESLDETKEFAVQTSCNNENIVHLPHLKQNIFSLQDEFQNLLAKAKTLITSIDPEKTSSLELIVICHKKLDLLQAIKFDDIKRHKKMLEELLAELKKMKTKVSPSALSSSNSILSKISSPAQIEEQAKIAKIQQILKINSFLTEELKNEITTYWRGLSPTSKTTAFLNELKNEAISQQSLDFLKGLEVFVEITESVTIESALPQVGKSSVTGVAGKRNRSDADQETVINRSPKSRFSNSSVG